MSDTNLIDQTKTTLRRTRLAYLGAIGLTYDFAAGRVEKRRDQVKALFDNAYDRGEDMEADARTLFKRAKDEVEELADDTVDELEQTVQDAKETVQELKEEIVLKVEKADKRAELSEKVEESDKYAPYLEKVSAYDKAADPIHIMKIVDHLGAALSSRDSMFVACSDETERKTVARNWLRKTLNVDGDLAALDEKVQSVCQTMKADRLKDRVVFYYLAAKAEGKLDTL
ncbi:DUF2853 family protein [Algimonas porphyrae]|uniref:DUF3164 family protein n=1 Tax=Algimonas porphyrae TaxID=1128113 RepID=A0ABQ5V101_9PROT|nr:DUF2853 family protein [Algimonas porphyrae]GLQ21103.1 hypothetical protein GCM10007854_20580 [Algimonas porphyrae]